MKRSEVKTLHFKQVQRAERQLERAMQSLLRQQVRGVARELVETGTPSIDLLWRPAEQDAALVEAATPPIARAMITGALSELELAKSTKAGFEFPAELPEWMRQRVQQSLNETFAANYWLRINATTREALRETIEFATAEGESVADIAAQIQLEFGDTYTRSRARNIAMTESSAALNSGHLLGVEAIEEESGLPMGKEWLSVLSDTTRDAHAALDGVEVPVAAMFNLAGYEVPYPGHWSLPAAQRCQCKCTILSNILV